MTRLDERYILLEETRRKRTALEREELDILAEIARATKCDEVQDINLGYITNVKSEERRDAF